MFQRSYWRLCQLALGGLCLFLALSLQRVPTVAQSSITQAQVAEILDGNQVFIQNQQARVNDLAKLGQRVRTGQARAQLSFNTGAVGRLAPNSILTVGEKCAKLNRGTLLVNGVANGCTASVTTGVRGTTYVLEVDDENNTQVKVLEGEVIVAKANPADEPVETAEPTDSTVVPTEPLPNLLAADPERVQATLKRAPVTRPATSSIKPETAEPETTAPETAEPETAEEPIVLTAGQKATIESGEDPVVAQLSQAEFESLLQGTLFNGFSAQIPGIDKVRQSFESLFPGVPFPINLPSISIPGLPGIPGLPF